MGAGHAHPLYRPGTSPVHTLPPEVKIVAALGFTAAVVSTPREAFWAFGAYALVVTSIAAVARIPAGWLAARATVVLPFLLFAALLPVIGAGPRVEVAGLTLSQEGLLGAWNIVAKATLGVASSLLLVGTTPPRDLILGLDRLRCPRALTQIATFMLRYLDVVTAEARRMRTARLSRGDDPRFLWQARGFAAGLGTLFVRSYERGERVWLAMRSRGWQGRLPDTGYARPATPAQWALGAGVPALAVATALVAVVTT